jgi:hypothetical protein
MVKNRNLERDAGAGLKMLKALNGYGLTTSHYFREVYEAGRWPAIVFRRDPRAALVPRLPWADMKQAVGLRSSCRRRSDAQQILMPAPERAVRMTGGTPFPVWGPAFAKALRRGGQAVPAPRISGQVRPSPVKSDQRKNNSAT